jgi:hypothetical protein
MNKDNEQFVLSYELLALMRWIIQHESKSLKRIITRALSRGLRKSFHTSDDTNAPLDDTQELQHAIVEFLELMDTLLWDVTEERAQKDALERNLMPALDQIDTSVCNESIIKSSLARASSKLERNPSQNAKDVLYKELLKQWKPCKLENH